jgi:hypothetical protein
MFWRKKREEWFDYAKIKPPIGVEVIFCDFDHYWVGKIASINKQEKEALVVWKDEFQKFIFSSAHSKPFFWRFLPSRPSRLNIESFKT